MKFKIQIVLDDADGQTQIEDVIQIDKDNDQGNCAGLSLLESKELLKRKEGVKSALALLNS